MDLIAQVHWDWTISFGTMIHLGALLVGGTMLYDRMKQRTEKTEEKVGILFVWVRELIRVTPGVDPSIIANIKSNGEKN